MMSPAVLYIHSTQYDLLDYFNSTNTDVDGTMTVDFHMAVCHESSKLLQPGPARSGPARSGLVQPGLVQPGPVLLSIIRKESNVKCQVHIQALF